MGVKISCSHDGLVGTRGNLEKYSRHFQARRHSLLPGYGDKHRDGLTESEHDGKTQFSHELLLKYT